MYLKDYGALIEALKGEMPNLILFEGEIGSIYLQTFNRNIDNRNIDLFGIWQIDVNEEYRRKGYFSNLIVALEEASFPVCVNDIVNPHVENFLKKRGWNFKKFSKPGYSQVLMAYFL